MAFYKDPVKDVQFFNVLNKWFDNQNVHTRRAINKALDPNKNTKPFK